MTERYELEYTFSTSPRVLFNRLSTPAGLAEWFADDVNIKDGMYSFEWDGNKEYAEVISKKDNNHIRFKWIDEEEEDAYFEFKIEKDELTGDLALIITDFASLEELADAANLWDSQIAELKHAIGL